MKSTLTFPFRDIERSRQNTFPGSFRVILAPRKNVHIMIALSDLLDSSHRTVPEDIPPDLVKVHGSSPYARGRLNTKAWHFHCPFCSRPCASWQRTFSAHSDEFDSRAARVVKLDKLIYNIANRFYWDEIPRVSQHKMVKRSMSGLLWYGTHILELI